MAKSNIRIYCNDTGVCYASTRRRLIDAGLATTDMFPEAGEAWRGNGLAREPGEPLWSVQRGRGTEFIVTWGYCAEEETD